MLEKENETLDLWSFIQWICHDPVFLPVLLLRFVPTRGVFDLFSWCTLSAASPAANPFDWEPFLAANTSQSVSDCFAYVVSNWASLDFPSCYSRINLVSFLLPRSPRPRRWRELVPVGFLYMIHRCTFLARSCIILLILKLPASCLHYGIHPRVLVLVTKLVS